MADLRGVPAHTYLSRLEGPQFGVLCRDRVLAGDIYLFVRQLSASWFAQLRVKVDLNPLIFLLFNYLISN